MALSVLETMRDHARLTSADDGRPARPWLAPQPAGHAPLQRLGLSTLLVASLAATVVSCAIGLVTLAHLTGAPAALAMLALVVLGTGTALRSVWRSFHRMSAELREIASHDPLTGALNHEAFERTFGAWVGNGLQRRLESSLLLVDVDGLDAVNRAHGHDAGDAALRHLSSIIYGCIRETDAFARLDGEEFALLFPATSGAEAVVAAERIRSEVARRSLECGARFTISIGVTGSHAFSDPWAAATRALSLAKSAGANRVVLAETETQAESEFEHDLPGHARPVAYELEHEHQAA